MAIADQTLHTLEFPKIREQLARHTSFSASRDLALELLPSTDIVEVRQRQALTGEARALLDEYPDVTIGGARDVRRAARHAARGGVLDGQTFIEVAATLASSRALRARLLKLEAALFPHMIEQAEFLPALPQIEEEILRTIGDDGAVMDSASAELARLRREIRIAFGRLQEKLQNMVSSSSYAGALQEPIITVRNGRYVVPVKASHRKDVRGLVHDQSSSGATLYVEPMAVVELNNRWRELQSAEEEEVQRILAALSGRVGAASAQIVAAVETLAAIDMALGMRPLRPGPALREAGDCRLSRRSGRGSTRLLCRSFTLNRGSPPPAGPDDRGADDDLAGRGVPAAADHRPEHRRQDGGPEDDRPARADGPGRPTDPGRRPLATAVFGQIFADIGDEQSIEQSLSTFSSHMTNIIRVLRALEEQPIPEEVWAADRYDLLRDEPPLALVLFDELGAGTDPVEGAALARAIIERLLELEVFGVATTHYAELKAFAYNTPGVQNASVEFDVETLAPTYRLTSACRGARTPWRSPPASASAATWWSGRAAR